MDYQRDERRVHLIVYHLIFCPKRRRKVLVKGVAKECNALIQEVCASQDWQVLELAIMPDHIHLFVREGSIVIGCSKKVSRSPNYWLQVGITNTDRALIDWLHATFGGHISDNSHAPSRRAQRPCWAWRIMSNEAIVFLHKLLPYLRTKKPQAIIAIEFQEHMVTYPLQSHKAKSQEHLATREAYRVALRALTLGQHSLP